MTKAMRFTHRRYKDGSLLVEGFLENRSVLTAVHQAPDPSRDQEEKLWINWSALGSVPLETAEAFAQGLLRTIEALKTDTPPQEAKS